MCSKENISNDKSETDTLLEAFNKLIGCEILSVKIAGEKYEGGGLIISYKDKLNNTCEFLFEFNENGMWVSDQK